MAPAALPDATSIWARREMYAVQPHVRGRGHQADSAVKGTGQIVIFNREVEN